MSAENLLGPVVVGIVLAAGGVLMLVLAMRIRAGKLPRNRWAGMRTSLTLKSDKAWDAAQRATLPSLWIAGPCLIVLGLADVVLGLTGAADGVMVTMTVLALVVVIAMAVFQMVKGSAAAREADPD